MVGMLQAPYGTQLYTRMEKEGRILHEMTGDNADGSTNILPKMGANILKEGYQRLMAEIYSPKFFYQRVKTFLSIYKTPPSPPRIRIEELSAFFSSIWRLGIIGVERREYWRLFFWAMLKYPRKFALAITFTIYGYHFRTVNEANS
jgi:hypothetical protein